MKCRVCGYEGSSLKELFRPGVQISVKFAGLEVDACPECGVMQVANLDEIHKRMEEAKPKSA